MISKISIIKTIDTIIGSFLCQLLPRPTPVLKQNISRILIIRPGGIGDAVLLLPVLASIKKLLPEVKIDILAERRNCDVFELSPHISSVFCYDSLSELFRVLCGGHDVVIDTEQWHRLSAVVSRLTRAPLTAGFGTNERERLFNISVAYSHDDHEMKSFVSLARAVFPVLPDVPLLESFYLSERAVQKSQSLLSSLAGVRGYVALFPGASVPEKRWPVHLWRTLAEYLSACGMGIVVIGGGDVESIVEPIIGGLPGLNAVGCLTLAETAAVLKRSQLLVCGDSGVMHLAWLIGTPTVSLFGPSSTFKWSPACEPHIVINKKLPCSPCTIFGNTPPCPIKAKCMRDISVDDVLYAVTSLLKPPVS